jgi:glyoxalase family protein
VQPRLLPRAERGLELATLSHCFTIDEPAESLGEELKLPGRHERMRERLEQTLIPLRNPRTSAASR